jgi:hypothetical protein
MLHLELTQAEAAVIERLFNQVTGIDNMRAIIPIHDKMIVAARVAGIISPIKEADAVSKAA